MPTRCGEAAATTSSAVAAGTIASLAGRGGTSSEVEPDAMCSAVAQMAMIWAVDQAETETDGGSGQDRCTSPAAGPLARSCELP